MSLLTRLFRRKPDSGMDAQIRRNITDLANFIEVSDKEYHMNDYDTCFLGAYADLIQSRDPQHFRPDPYDLAMEFELRRFLGLSQHDVTRLIFHHPFAQRTMDMEAQKAWMVEILREYAMTGTLRLVTNVLPHASVAG